MTKTLLRKKQISSNEGIRKRPNVRPTRFQALTNGAGEGTFQTRQAAADAKRQHGTHPHLQAGSSSKGQRMPAFCLT